MRVARIVEITKAEGIGSRFALWLQGCPHHCKGCYAEAMHNPEGGREMSVEEIAERIRAVKERIEGVTFLGGEPLFQAAELRKLCKIIRKWDLGVTLFTGYVYEEIERNGTEDMKEILRCTDLLIDGPYLEEQRDFSRPLVGSKNQRFLFLTNRYGSRDPEIPGNRLELRIDKEGRILINGMGDFPKLTALLRAQGMLPTKVAPGEEPGKNPERKSI